MCFINQVCEHLPRQVSPCIVCSKHRSERGERVVGSLVNLRLKGTVLTSSKMATKSGVPSGPFSVSRVVVSVVVVYGDINEDDIVRECSFSRTASDTGSWLEQWPFREGRQSIHSEPDLTQAQDIQHPLPLHRQHTSMSVASKTGIKSVTLQGLLPYPIKVSVAVVNYAHVIA